jgi:hypothetical protein
MAYGLTLTNAGGKRKICRAEQTGRRLTKKCRSASQIGWPGQRPFLDRVFAARVEQISYAPLSPLLHRDFTNCRRAGDADARPDTGRDPSTQGRMGYIPSRRLRLSSYLPVPVPVLHVDPLQRWSTGITRPVRGSYGNPSLFGGKTRYGSISATGRPAPSSIESFES